jgi:hypothetical protein
MAHGINFHARLVGFGATRMLKLGEREKELISKMALTQLYFKISGLLFWLEVSRV